MWPFTKKEENLVEKVEDSDVERTPFPETFARCVAAINNRTDYDGNPIEPGKNYSYILGNGWRVIIPYNSAL